MDRGKAEPFIIGWEHHGRGFCIELIDQVGGKLPRRVAAKALGVGVGLAQDHQIGILGDHRRAFAVAEPEWRRQHHLAQLDARCGQHGFGFGE